MKERKLPVRVFHSVLTGTVYALTRYTVKPHPYIDGETCIRASVKHDVTADVEAIVAERAAPLVEFAEETIRYIDTLDPLDRGLMGRRDAARDALARFRGEQRPRGDGL